MPSRLRAELKAGLIFPDQFNLTPTTPESLRVIQRFTDAGGNAARLFAWVVTVKQHPTPPRSRLERWRRNLAGLLTWRGLPDRLRENAEEIYLHLVATLENPPPPLPAPKSAALPSLVAAVIVEEFRQRFPAETTRTIVERVRAVLVASVPEVFPESTTSEALSKRIRRVPRRTVLAWHNKAFPAPR
jgi:hypothetical protein